MSFPIAFTPYDDFRSRSFRPPDFWRLTLHAPLPDHTPVPPASFFFPLPLFTKVLIPRKNPTSPITTPRGFDFHGRLLRPSGLLLPFCFSVASHERLSPKPQILPPGPDSRPESALTYMTFPRFRPFISPPPCAPAERTTSCLRSSFMTDTLPTMYPFFDHPGKFFF